MAALDVNPLDDVVRDVFPEAMNPWEQPSATVEVGGGVRAEPWRVVRLGSVQHAIDDQIDALFELRTPTTTPPSCFFLAEGDSLPLVLRPLGKPLPVWAANDDSDFAEELFLALEAA